MAYLNVRERRVEAKIAYLGPGRAGKATNIEQLGLRATPRATPAARSVTDDVGEVLSLDWQAPPSVHFRDCSLAVKVVAACGPLSAERTRALVRDADGVVLVLDAHPGSQLENKASIALLHDALGATKKKPVPVVVQVNKTDLPDALTPATVLDELGAKWPHVGAAATRGDGVVETLERALEEVLAALREDERHAESETMRPVARATSPRAEGNPLLAALRQVLRETVSEHVAELEARFMEKLTLGLERGLASIAPDTTEIAALRRTIVEESARTRSALDGMREHIELTARATAELRTVVATGTAETTRALAAHANAIQTLEEHRDGPPGAFEEIDTQLERLKEEIRSETIRALEVRSRSDREHTTAAIAPVRRALDALAADAKQSDARAKVAELADAVTELRARTEALASIASTVRDLEKALQRDVRDVVVRRIAGVEELVRTTASETQESTVRGEQGIGEVRARVAELVEELKKPKKGWFT